MPRRKIFFFSRLKYADISIQPVQEYPLTAESPGADLPHTNRCSPVIGIIRSKTIVNIQTATQVDSSLCFLPQKSGQFSPPVQEIIGPLEGKLLLNPGAQAEYITHNQSSSQQLELRFNRIYQGIRKSEIKSPGWAFPAPILPAATGSLPPAAQNQPVFILEFFDFLLGGLAAFRVVYFNYPVNNPVSLSVQFSTGPCRVRLPPQAVP